LATDVIHYQHRYLTGAEETMEMHMKETDQLVSIDKLDSSIINKLSGNARATIVEIADSVGASPRVVAYRLRKMEDNGLIEGYRAIIDYSKLGLTYYKVFLALSSAPLQEKKKLLEYIRSSPIVIYRVEGIGPRAEIDFEVIVGSELQLSRFMKELSFKFPGIVGEYSTMMFTETLKVKYLPSLSR
jgi:DNA-binding Lrp family transcriptional regulator